MKKEIKEKQEEEAKAEEKLMKKLKAEGLLSQRDVFFSARIGDIELHSVNESAWVLLNYITCALSDKVVKDYLFELKKKKLKGEYFG